MKDMTKIPEPEVSAKWTEKQAVARGWLEVVRLAERERRKREGELLVRIHRTESA